MTTASIQHLTSIVRTHADNGDFGSPYEFCVTVNWYYEDGRGPIAGLWAITTAPSMAERRAVIDILKANGAVDITWDRRKKNRSIHTAKFDLTTETAK